MDERYMFAAPVAFENRQYPGLSKREYAAIAAMQGLCTAYFVDREDSAIFDQINFEDIAVVACNCADALFKELEKPFKD